MDISRVSPIALKKKKKKKKKKRNRSIGKIYDWIFSIHKAWILVHTKPLYSNVKLIAFLRNACILQDTGLECCQATVSSFKRIVHMYSYILTGKIHPIFTQLGINQSIQLMSEYELALIV